MPFKRENKVKYGLKNVYYAVINYSEDGTMTFAAPVRIPGAVNLNLTPQGETNTFYADDVAFYVSAQNSGYQGDLEIARVPDSFAKDVLKENLDETDQVFVENSTAEIADFALLFEFSGDVHAVRHVMYNCTVARPNVTGATATNTKEPQTSTLSLTASPLADGKVKARTTANTPDATYNNWFKSVWQPAETPSPNPENAEPTPGLEAA